MKPSELASTDDLDDFWMDNIKYLEQLEAIIEKQYPRQENIEFFRLVVSLIESQQEYIEELLEGYYDR